MTRPRRPLAFVDVETTGLDHLKHELLELAVIRVDPYSMVIEEEYSTLVRPEHPETATAEAIAINGYTPEAWADAPGLIYALADAAPLLEGTMLAGHGVGFDHRFLVAGYQLARLPLRLGDYHLLDTASLAWPLLVRGEIDSLSLDAVCRALGIERPHPHRALADARCSLAVARAMLARVGRAA